MNCYFDIENFTEFSKQTINIATKEKSMSCLRMLKKNFNIIFNNVVYDELEDELKILLEEFQSGFEGEIIFLNNLEIEIIKNNTNFLGSVVLMDNPKVVEQLKNKNQILVGALSEETETLSRLYISEDDLHKEEQIGKDITPENHLNIKGLPINKIFIIDRYIFKGSEIGGNLSLFEYNIEKLLVSIFEGRKSKVDIIFVYQINNNVSVNHKHYDNGPDKSKIVAKIKGLVHKNCPKPNICLIAVPQGRIKDEHDRHIITDYLRIKSGDSFIYFESNGEIATQSLFVDFYSHGKKTYRINSDTLMEKINNYTNDSIKLSPNGNYIPKGYSQTDLIVF